MIVYISNPECTDIKLFDGEERCRGAGFEEEKVLWSLKSLII